MAKPLENPGSSLLISIIGLTNLIEASYLVNYIIPIFIARDITSSSISTSKYINEFTSNRDLTKRER